MSRIRLSKTGQAATEMAIFGSLILVVFSMLLAYMQRQNEEQYVTMETFRRSLQKANDANASVSLNLIQYRRFAEASGGFWQGNRNMLGAGSSVFWAVPQVGGQANNLAIFRINEDEIDLTQKLRLDDTNENNNLEIRDITTAANMSFSEATQKLEDNTRIQNIRTSGLSDSITTNIEIVDPGPDEHNEADDTVIEIVPMAQQLYHDAQDGQYKYSSTQPSQTITRSKTWTTPFQD